MAPFVIVLVNGKIVFAVLIRHYLRGWGANIDSEMRRRKEALRTEIAVLDLPADTTGMSTADWARWYEVERELTFLSVL